jgi:hypothetical protein
MMRALRIGRSLLLAAPLLLVAAKCVEHTTLYRDNAGNLHIVGEIHNETDIQGTELIVGGTLYDGAGNVLATAQTPICPSELSPHTFSTFDIEFQNSSAVPQPARYDVRPISGKTLTQALPPLHVTLSSVRAKRTPIGVEITGSIRAGQAYAGFYYGCAAFYNSAGDVIRQLTIIGFGTLPADVTQPIDVILPNMPTEAKTMRLWVVGPGESVLQSSYQAIMTDSITIQ